MALNQSAINVRVINGAETTQFSQALDVTSTVTVSFLRGLSTIKSILSTSLSTISSSFVFLKDIVASLVTSIASIAQTGRGKILEASSTTINTLANQLSLFRDLIATSTVTSLFNITLNKLVLQAQVVTATIITATNRLVTLLAYSTSSVSISKAIDFTMSLIVSTVTSTIETVRNLLVNLSVSVSSTVTLLAIRFYYQILTVISTTTSSIVKGVEKLLTISVNCGIILSKLVYKTLTVLSTSTLSIVKSVISFTRYPVDRLIYAATKIRKVFYQ